MVERDPNTGQYRSSSGGSASSREYLNSDVVMWNTTTSPPIDETPDGASDWDWTSFDNNDGEPRRAGVYVDIDRPDDHLVEIYGFQTLHGDHPLNENNKSEVFAYLGHRQVGKGWDGAMSDSEDLIYYSSAITTDQLTDGPAADSTNTQVWFQKPYLSAGKLTAVHSVAEDGDGEVALIMYYDFVEAPDQMVLNQLLQDR